MEQRTLPNFFPEMNAKTPFAPLTTTREERGQVIADSYGNIQRFDDTHYSVNAAHQPKIDSVHHQPKT